MRIEKLFLAFLFLGVFLLAFVYITLGGLFYEQLKDFKGFIDTIRDFTVLNAILISLSASFVSTLIAFVFGVPLAYLLAREDFAGRSFLEGTLDIPMMIPHIVAGIALYCVFMRSGLIGAPLEKIGIIFTDTFLGIVVAMLFMSFPYLVNTAKEGFRSVDVRLENVARSLGASPWKVFREISFPLAFPSIFNGVVLCWARGISEFSAVLILAYFPKSAPILIYEKFTTFGLASSRPISVLLILICLLIFVFLRKPKGRKE
ncbi:MAG: molybdenum ABC transporter permease [Candidatus Hecatellales archaeon]|nr:MAG: molybdenum ABC transporter permease [Candidatus Hecatellales archaeon]